VRWYSSALIDPHAFSCCGHSAADLQFAHSREFTSDGRQCSHFGGKPANDIMLVGSFLQRLLPPLLRLLLLQPLLCCCCCLYITKQTWHEPLGRSVWVE
jgi:hypothetical protein